MRNTMSLLMLSFALAACSQPADMPQVDHARSARPVAQAAAPAAPNSTSTARILAPVLTRAGFGPVQFGDRLSAVERKLEEKSTPLGDRDPACSTVRFSQLPGARFMVEQGIITRADADTGVPNELGVKVGDTLAQARRKYAMIAVAPHKYLESGHYLVAPSRNARAAIVMEEDGNNIIKIRAGLEPAVSYAEACL